MPSNVPTGNKSDTAIPEGAVIWSDVMPKCADTAFNVSPDWLKYGNTFGGKLTGGVGVTFSRLTGVGEVSDAGFAGLVGVAFAWPVDMGVLKIDADRVCLAAYAVAVAGVWGLRGILQLARPKITTRR